MGSPISGVLAYIYLEFIESGPFKYIILNTARYFGYIDNILLIYTQDLYLHSITDRLNNVEPSIKFTYELESNCTLPFLDILVIRNINKLEFLVYRKPTCKNIHIHVYSYHNNNTKRGIIIGFFLSQRSAYLLSKFLRRSLLIFIIKGFRTIVFIIIVISTTFRSRCPPVFFRCLSNSGTFTEHRTTSFIETTGVACSDSVGHNRVQVLSIPVLLLACSEDWTCNHQIIVSLEA